MPMEQQQKLDDLGPLPPPAAFQISSRDFDRLAAFIHEQSGIQLPRHKKPLIEARLFKHLQRTKTTVAAYIELALDPANSAERYRLIELITTHETSFFREKHHFDLLRSHASAAAGRRYCAWSSAASSGQEAYSVAMVLTELAESGVMGRVHATDVSRRILEQAKSAVYREADIRPIAEALRKKYLLRSKTTPPRFKVSPALRERVTFARLNLMDPSYSTPSVMDAIFCRNVLIYFDKPTQKQVLTRLLEKLKPGGLLCLGHAESANEFRLPLRAVGPTAYLKEP